METTSPMFAVSEKVLVPHVDRQYEAKVRKNGGIIAREDCG